MLEVLLSPTSTIWARPIRSLELLMSWLVQLAYPVVMLVTAIRIAIEASIVA